MMAFAQCSVMALFSSISNAHRLQGYSSILCALEMFSGGAGCVRLGLALVAMPVHLLDMGTVGSKYRGQWHDSQLSMHTGANKKNTQKIQRPPRAHSTAKTDVDPIPK